MTEAEQRFYEASCRLAQAVHDQRFFYVMMGECPKDDIDVALDEWKRSHQAYKPDKFPQNKHEQS